jgi:dihydropteroate synthase
MKWRTARFNIDLSTTKVMGIVNITPDSFSETGGHLASTRAALAHCERLLLEGVDILDIGGESTRPGALPVPVAQELERVLPVVREAVKLGVPVSVDTYKPAVMQAVLGLGADIINDIWALRWAEPGAHLTASEVLLQYPGCGVCLMHMHGNPQTMQLVPMDSDVVPQVLLFLERQCLELVRQGIHKSQIVVDPGIGFGKTVAQNFELLARQQELLALGYPLLAGWSRKSSLASVTNLDKDLSANSGRHPRMVASIAAALLAVERGAAIVRVHDVRETVQALQVWHAISSPGNRNSQISRKWQ